MISGTYKFSDVATYFYYFKCSSFVFRISFLLEAVVLTRSRHTRVSSHHEVQISGLFYLPDWRIDICISSVCNFSSIFLSADSQMASEYFFSWLSSEQVRKLPSAWLPVSRCESSTQGDVWIIEATWNGFETCWWQSQRKKLRGQYSRDQG
jgi:hypothetical protein